MIVGAGPKVPDTRSRAVAVIGVLLVVGLLGAGAGAVVIARIDLVAAALGAAVLVTALTLMVRGPRPRPRQVHLLIERLDESVATTSSASLRPVTAAAHVQGTEPVVPARPGREHADVDSQLPAEHRALRRQELPRSGW